ncbi:hypothetical protein MNV49_005232 [Pseudohyphozyma bogoriensis]|nr:hypothetical protein MNV49_005232 [Pseudohyphozyma bogoriensis]
MSDKCVGSDLGMELPSSHQPSSGHTRSITDRTHNLPATSSATNGGRLKRRRSGGLNPERAYRILEEADGQIVMAALKRYQEEVGKLDWGSLKRALASGLRNNCLIDFSDVEVEHLQHIGVRIGDLAIKDGATTEWLTQEGEALLSSVEFLSYRGYVAKFVYYEKEAGCRMIIDSIIIPALVAAQAVQDKKPVQIEIPAGKTPKDFTGYQYALFPKQQISSTKGRTLFPAVLTNGVYFKFYVAHVVDDAGPTIYASKTYDVSSSAGC